MNEQDSSQGLRELRLKSLTEIVSGGVKMKRNNHLCFTNTINWDDILRKETRNMYRVSLEDTPPPSCGSCDVTCGGGGCWGRGASMCQVLTSTICSEQCGNARCKGPAREDCCDIECASGCTGPSDKDCITCLHVNNTGACEYTCPPARIYDPLTQRNIPNPHFKFHYHDHCVDACPSNLLVEDNGCVKSCRRGLHNDGTGKCVQCSDELCSGDKECYGVNHQDG
uniref:receptor protein-tyrosine kinase n=2 Tax=Ciona intestinalis TaxID=7719 RepID=F6VNS2_CIOIN